MAKKITIIGERVQDPSYKISLLKTAAYLGIQRFFIMDISCKGKSAIDILVGEKEDLFLKKIRKVGLKFFNIRVENYREYVPHISEYIQIFKTEVLYKGIKKLERNLRK